MKLSVVVPSIRLGNWERLFASIERSSAKHDFELLLIGPRYNPILEQNANVRFIQDYGSPTRGLQIGIYNAAGDIVTWASDDSTFVDGSLDKCVDALLAEDTNTVVVAKYSEGEDVLQNDEYYQLNKAYPACPGIPDDWWIFNQAFFYREMLWNMGGVDTRFQTQAFACADCAIRGQKAGVKVVFVKDKLCYCEHGQSDHLPIELTHVYEDTPLYHWIHGIPNRSGPISLDNWINAETVWKKRYG